MRRDRVYVCDTLNHRVRILQGGNEVGSFDRSGEENLDGPVGIAEDRNGRLHVLEAGTARVLVLSRDGSPVRRYGGYGTRKGKMLGPRSIVIGAEGRAFISDASAGFVHVFQEDGTFLSRFRPVDGAASERSWTPMRVILEPDGGLYVWTAGHRAF